MQPDSTGASVVTDHGYVDDLYALYRRSDPRLQLVKLGRPGETTTSMIKGAVCDQYRDAGSQLAAAVAFLTAHRGHVVLVTLDIGANNVDGCVTPLKTLRTAAPSTRIVGMNYYDPFLAAWLQGTAGQQTAQASVQLTDYFNGVLAADHAHFKVPVASVAAEYRTDNFTVIPLVNLPVNVAAVCLLAWMCASSPVGPNIHANTLGYRVIADAFVDTIGPVLRTG